MRKITDYLIGAFIFFSSTFYMPGQNFHDSQRILFQIAGMLFFAMILCMKPVRQIRNAWVNSYLILAIVMFVVHSSIKALGIVPLVNIFVMTMLFYAFSNYLTDKSVVYKAIQGIVAINIIFIIFQFLNIDPLLINDRGLQNNHLVGLFGHPMNMGIFCSVVLPYVFFKSKVWAGLTLICLIASGSYISILLGILGFLVYLFLTNKKAFRIAVYVALAAFVLFTIYVLIFYDYPDKNTIIRKFTLRYEMNYPLLKATLSNPWKGYGLGTFPQISQQIQSKEGIDMMGIVDVTWNDYLGCSLEMGVFVFFIFFGLFKQTLMRFAQAVKTKELSAIFCSLMTIPIGIIFHSYMNYINVGVICVVMFVLFEMCLKKEEVC